MGKVRAKASQPVDAVSTSINRELEKRGNNLKPIEIVKIAIAAYLAHIHAEDNNDSPIENVFFVENANLYRGTQSAIDQMLFNANYWKAAYGQIIANACSTPETAQKCLRAVSVWTSHTLKLNTLSPDETIAVFERFCPPFAVNHRRGSHERNRAGKGPLPDFRKTIDDIALLDTEPKESIEQLYSVLATMEKEAATYEAISPSGTLNALFDVLPAWCLQNRIYLVSGDWWDDCDVMSFIIDALHARFVELGSSEVVCRYFLDSCYEAMDAYHRSLTSDLSPLSDFSIPELTLLIQEVRSTQPNFEIDGYGDALPTWLINKEQLIWNILVCSIYGPSCARPLLVDSPDLLSADNYASKTDVITELARTSFTRYTNDRITSQADQEFLTFTQLPADLRDSSIAYITSIHRKLETLGYEILPIGSCYPERRVASFTASEIECLAILEHRRWLAERQKAGWRYGESKDVDRRRSPYLVPWEELPDRAKEWNRSAIRSIPNLLSSVNLAIVR